MAVSGAPGVPYVRSAGPRFTVGGVVGIAMIFAGFLVFMFGTLASALTGFLHPALVAGIGFVLMAAGGAAMAMSEEAARPTAVPPPPPSVQAPEHRAARGEVVEIPCPNCGASPKSVDRFGVATCEYCETRFLVH